MSYSKTNWQNLPNTSTPINATNLNKMETGIADANGAIAVSTYSTSGTYAVGDYVIYNNILYKCKTAITEGEAFNGSKWQQIKIAEEINNTGVSVSTTEPSGNNKNKVWLKQYINYFNKDDAILNKYLNTDGSVDGPSSVSSVSDFIPVTSGTVYTLYIGGEISSSYYFRVCYYNSSKTYISRTEKTNTKQETFTTPTNTAYIRFQFETTQINNVILQKANTIEKSIIYILNNDKYEKFDTLENVDYSTGEVKVGKWVNR